MSTVMHPVGDRPPNVYWRRRVVALVAVVVVVALLVWGIAAVVRAVGGGDEPTAQPTPQPTQQASGGGDDPAAATGPSPSTSTTAAAEGEVPACTAETTAVVATADAASYALGGTAKVGMTITNTGTAACTMDAGSAALELVVVSGEDRIWSSDDCQEGAENRPTTVEPGEAGMLASTVEWTLVRSAKGCAKDLPALKAGTYQLTARAGEITSEPVVLTLTG